MTPAEPTPFAERELAAIDAALAGHEVEPDLADVAELTRALRAERPEVQRRFARDMDGWAAGGFKGRGPRVADRAVELKPRRRRLRLGLAVSAIAACGFAAVVIPAVQPDDLLSVVKEEGRSPIAAPVVDDEVSPQQRDESSSSRAFDTSEGSRRSLAAPPRGQLRRSPGRSVERSASLALAAPPDGLERVAAGVARVTDQVGGYVARSTVDAQAGGGTASFELRVPAQRLTQALADLSDLASVRSRTQASVDITRTARSAAERLEEARAERRGLLRQLESDGSATTRARLRAVGRRIADAKADLARADRRADLAKVSVTVAGDPQAGGVADDGRWTPGDALGDAARVLEVVAGVALVAFAVILPLLLLGGPLLLAGRRRTRRRREAALDAI